MEHDPESEKLIAHEFTSDEHGRPLKASVPAGEHARGPSDEELAMPPPTYSPPHTDQLENTGRPDWLKHVTSSERTPRQKRFVFFGGLAALMLLAVGAFMFAFGPTDGYSNTEHVFVQDGEVWKDEASVSRFPTYIGHPGTYSTGAPAGYAQEMSPVPSPTRGGAPMATSVPGFGEKYNPFRHMGPLTPYQSGEFGVDNSRHLRTPISDQGVCTLQQVHILHRHGARYPTTGSPTELVAKFIERNQLGGRVVKFTGPLAFMNDYVYRLGKELLVPVGRNQLHQSGVKAAVDYGALVAADAGAGKRMFVRAGSQQRIVDSAIAFMTGFYGNSWSNQTDFEIQLEDPGFNTTLASNFACAAAAKAKSNVSDWVNTYLKDAVTRLKPHVEGRELTPQIVYGMQQLCAYDTAAFGHSDFCALFTEEEWNGFEYSWDINFHGYAGPSSHTGAAQGLGWLNEFISRLTSTPWDARTQTSENSTVNSQPELFPVDRAFYADFAHDTTITAVIAAMRLAEFDKKPELSNKDRAFRSSKVVPFAARMIFEVFTCPGEIPQRLSRRRFNKAPDMSKVNLHEYVRLKINDAVVPLSQLSHCDQRDDGMCLKEQFLASHADRNDQGWWDRCRATA
ncbi:hypothetical protein MCUN1_002713 [Malassezia cuniculi]|uniref:3-phytase A n=1 Tax=Malassezia cuniculi TaxID=948313 RepID=A0AAF0ESD1_9BASI|nr:hypothetical protein MCUN1_002713 [Malassezia cuniculi]